MISINQTCATPKATTKPAPIYRVRREAMDAAVFALGPLARHGFEFTTFQCDGGWRWRSIDDETAPRVTGFQTKANGGKRGLMAVNAVWKPKTVQIALELPEDQAHALARLCKALSFEEVQRLTAGPHDHDRTDTALMKLVSALKSAGISAR